MKNPKSSSAASLRNRAEELLQKKESLQEALFPDINTLKLYHELQVYQIEMEMLNQELLESKAEADAASQKYSTLYDFAPSGYFTLDIHGIICELNLCGAKMLDKERPTLVKSNFKQFVAPDSSIIFLNFLEKIFKTKSKQSCEIRLIITKNPSLYVILEGILSDDNQHCYLTAVDISGLKWGGGDQHSFHLSNTLFDSIPDLIFTKDKAGICMGCNPQLAELIGRPREEIIGKSDRELFGKEMADSFIEVDRRVIESQHPETREERVIYPDGRERVFETIKTPYFGQDGNLIGLIGISRDITKVKQLELELRNRESLLEELNATKDKFFSIIAHDLRTPFNSILGFSNLLADQVKNKEYENLEKYAAIIQESSARSMSLLTNLMQWAQSQGTRMKFNPENFDIVSLIKEMAELFVNSASQKSIKILCELPQSRNIFADKGMISTVVRNLISNAIKFSFQGGEILLTCNQEQNELTLSIADHGIGMDQETIKGLFRIDANKSKSGTLNEMGTGLGLILCREFVDKHQGKIWAQSEEKKGSVFHFTIPASGITEEK